jgi:hypothetical protein
MASSGKKKTTMAKLARETRLRERRLNKQAKKDARKQASAEHLASPEGALNAATTEAQPDAEPAPLGLVGARETEGAVKADAEQRDAGKDFALRRLRDAPDEELALFERTLRQDAVSAGASEQELREAQSGRPEHG